MRRVGGLTSSRCLFQSRLHIWFKRFYTLPKVIVIAGQTATGKSRISIDIARILDGEIISADSVQRFKHLNIGSDKVPYKNRQGVRHHMLDEIDPKEGREVKIGGDCFSRPAREITREILSRGKVPIVTGGSGMYLKWYLSDTVPHPPVLSATDVNAKVASLREQGWEQGFKDLQDFDPVFATKIYPNDFYRLAKATLIYERSNRKYSSYMDDFMLAGPGQNSLSSKHFDFRCFFLYSKEGYAMKEIIDSRCESMIARGFLSEVLTLLETNRVSKDVLSRAIGYKQAVAYLQDPEFYNAKRFVQFVSDFQSASRQYAKRQKSWFRRMDDMYWIDPADPVDKILGLFNMEKSAYAEELSNFNRIEKKAILEEDAVNSAQLMYYVPKLKLFSSTANFASIIRHLTGRIRDFQKANTEEGRKEESPIC